MRWTEMAAFTPVMRTHEGNRPRDNLQIDQDEAVLAHFARMTSIYVALAPYLKSLSAEAAESGLPVQRPLFLHYEDDRQTYEIQDCYLYGADMLVAPVWKAGETQRSLYLPGDGEWVHLWSDTHYRGGRDITVEAPLGEPAIFYRADSSQRQLFEKLRTIG
jgi:alpha-glucosidase